MRHVIVFILLLSFLPQARAAHSAKMSDDDTTRCHASIRHAYRSHQCRMFTRLVVFDTHSVYAAHYALRFMSALRAMRRLLLFTPRVVCAHEIEASVIDVETMMFRDAAPPLATPRVMLMLPPYFMPRDAITHMMVYAMRWRTYAMRF